MQIMKGVIARALENSIPFEDGAQCAVNGPFFYGRHFFEALHGLLSLFWVFIFKLLCDLLEDVSIRRRKTVSFDGPICVACIEFIVRIVVCKGVDPSIRSL